MLSGGIYPEFPGKKQMDGLPACQKLPDNKQLKSNKFANTIRQITRMVKQLRINSFKSLKHIELLCKKVNVFIGEPNSGKSNIIEALSLFSPGIMEDFISKEVLRYTRMGDLFYDFNFNKPIEVFTETYNYWLRWAIGDNNIPENLFEFELREDHKITPPHDLVKIDHNGKLQRRYNIQTNFRYYQYKRLSSFFLGYSNSLIPPFGSNLPSLLLSNEDFRNWVSDFFEAKGFTLTMKPAENEINMSKMVNKSIYSYPYLSISETLQRIVFYILAIKSNQHNILLFDEPETNTFPFYTKFLGESIALDETNQFFITTHNPYLLLSLIEKTPADDINVIVTIMTKEYETKLIPLNPKQVAEVLDFNSDVFFNLKRIVE
jgi:AAA15 family ATPase/GTPase